MKIPKCFKAYDVRGKVPEELNEKLARRIGSAYVEIFKPRKVVVGHDIRLTSEGLAKSLIDGLRASGADVVDIGLCGTEEIYHAAFSMESEGVDGGIVVTASHNPANYNGMKFVTVGAKPVSGDNGLDDIAKIAVSDETFISADSVGCYTENHSKEDYIKHLLSYIDPESLKPLKIVVNSGNGGAGMVIDLLEKHLPVQFIKVNHNPDGTFPNGVPNPLLADKREETSKLVRENDADLGIAWDGDFDRCFFWDEKGNFIEGYYIVALLAAEILSKEPGAKILYDPRLIWNTEDVVSSVGGIPVITKTGHSFIKARMRDEGAVYGGEMSAHHYFKDFGYCDSGMIPWLLMCSLLSRSGAKMSSLVEDYKAAYPVSGEINSSVEDPDSIISYIEEKYKDGMMDYIDGLSVSFPTYRFNIRKSNTEPLLRLNVESRGDIKLMQDKTKELLQIIRK